MKIRLVYDIIAMPTKQTDWASHYCPIPCAFQGKDDPHLIVWEKARRVVEVPREFLAFPSPNRYVSSHA